MAYMLYATDPAGVIQGTVPYLKLTLAIIGSGIGAWSLEMDPDTDKAALLQPGYGIVARDGTGDNVETLVSGPVAGITNDVPEPSGDEPVSETLKVVGPTDEWWAGSRLIYPDPTQPATAQTASAYDIRTGPAETIMRALVNANAGPGALLARRIPGLTLEPDQGRGAVIKTSARFDKLSDVLTAAGVAGGLGWRIIHDGTARRFQVYEPVDRSAEIEFSRGIGNLRAYSYSLDAPTGTRAIVAGQGEGTARTIVERGLSTAESDWSMRVETFVDRRDTNDLALLAQAGDEALAETGPVAGLSMSPIDTPTIRYGRDYRVGDTVRVKVGDASIVDVVRQVTLEITADGVTVKPLIGRENEALVPKVFQQVKKLVRELGQIQRRL